MEDAALNEQHIGRIIPNPDPQVIDMDAARAKQYTIDSRGNRIPKLEKASRVMKQAEYVVNREELLLITIHIKRYMLNIGFKGDICLVQQII